MSSASKESAVQIMAENTGEVRIYIAQFFSKSRGKMIREYADSVREEDLASLSAYDQAKIRYFGLVNLGKEEPPQAGCKGGCSSCGESCHEAGVAKE